MSYICQYVEITSSKAVPTFARRFIRLRVCLVKCISFEIVCNEINALIIHCLTMQLCSYAWTLHVQLRVDYNITPILSSQF